MCFLAEVLDDRRIVNPRAVARGNRHAVLAAAADASAGEILLHNHPSGVLEPSEADLALAARAYEEGLGTAIVDNEAGELYVVVEPPAPRTRELLDVDELDGLLAPGGALAGLFQGYEDRPAQREMLRAVAARYNEGGVAVVEAGTGTGKSLAYLVPAARWAMRNGERTVVSTNTINLQEQLVSKDLPLVRRVMAGAYPGERFSWALVKGRGNYVSIRRLHLAAESAPSLFEDDRTHELETLRAWLASTRDGSLSDLSRPPSDEVWEEVRSDGDICLKARCPHFQECFYQRARREAASADLLVANHALLFSDVSLRQAAENWTQSAVLPPYRHVILDEGHNVEDAATLHLGAEVTRIGLFRILSRLERGGKGVLAAVEQAVQGETEGSDREEILARIDGKLRPGVFRAREVLSAFFDALEPSVPAEDEEPLRLGRGDERDPTEDPAVMERLDALAGAFARLGRQVEELRLLLEADEARRDRMVGRILDLQALERRLESARGALALVLDASEGRTAFVRWIEGRGRPGEPLRNVRLAAAPVEPGPLLREALFGQLEAAVVTSATLSTGRGRFAFVRERLGLTEPGEGRGRGPAARGRALPEDLPDWAEGTPVFADAEAGAEAPPEPLPVSELLLASPFDFARQAILGVPTDLPGHHEWIAFQEATARVASALAGITGGGVFVLFTSHRALRVTAGHLRSAGVERRFPLFVHGEGPRGRLLVDFTRAGNGILLGTSSFWEGVDVPGDPLRGLILQKIPFRVPTEPITQARTEAIEGRGGNGFAHYQVPLAALRLKQGFGRLIRSRTDRGAVLMLDRRILTASYGRRLRAALPDAPLVRGPWELVRTEIEAFYRRATSGDGPA